uniref:RNA-directed DNA polymerase n=1 Tax=Strongyloides venezuelensis TaxID=75913 RepID=A0A0K0FFG1_STRVS
MQKRYQIRHPKETSDSGARKNLTVEEQYKAIVSNAVKSITFVKRKGSTSGSVSLSVNSRTTSVTASETTSDTISTYISESRTAPSVHKSATSTYKSVTSKDRSDTPKYISENSANITEDSTAKNITNMSVNGENQNPDLGRLEEMLRQLTESMTLMNTQMTERMARMKQEINYLRQANEGNNTSGQSHTPSTSLFGANCQPQVNNCPPPESVIPKFTINEDFISWEKKFKSYCFRYNIQGEDLRVTLLLLMDSQVTNHLVINRIFDEDYEAISEFLTEHYDYTRDVAAEDLEVFVSRRLKKFDNLDTTAQKIHDLVEKAYPEESQKSKRNKKIECLRKILPLSIEFIYCSSEKATYDRVITKAKILWSKSFNYENHGRNASRNGNQTTYKAYGSHSNGYNYSSKKPFTPHNMTGPQLNFIKALEKPVEISRLKRVPEIKVPEEAKIQENLDKIRKEDNLLSTLVTINGIRTVAIANTGANCVVHSPGLASRLNLKSDNSSTVQTLQGIENVKKVNIDLNIKISGKNILVKDNIYISVKDFTNKRYQCIVGYNMKINVPQANITLSGEDRSVNVQEFIEEIKQKYPLCYASHEYDIGPGFITTGEFQIYNKEPDRFPIYPVPLSEKADTNEIIQRWVESGLLEPTNSNLLHPIMLLNKEDENDVTRKRFIADVRMGNSITIPVRYKSPTIQEILSTIGNFNYVSKIDLKSAFFQISIPEKSRPLFAIRTDIGNFQFTGLVQGGINSSALFQKEMDKIFIELKPNIQIYVDDILLFSKGSVETHKKLIEKFCSICNHWQLKISLEKIKISKLGAQPSEENISNILHRSIPKTKKTSLSFLQALNYFRHCIPNYAADTAILYEKFSGRDAKIEETLAKIPTLYHPDPSKEFILTTDASNKAIGSVLSQLDTNNKTKRGRDSTYLELFAISRSLRFFKFLLTGAKLLIRTDHKPLESIMKNNSDKKFVGLIEDIMQYDCKISYIPGSENLFADFLSRLSHDEAQVNNVEVKRKRGRPRKHPVITDNDTSGLLQANNQNNINYSLEETIKLSGSAQLPFLALPTDLNIQETQKNDIQCQEALKEGQIDGLKKGENNKDIELILIPDSCVKEIFKLAHDFNSHFSFLKTKEILNRQLYIPSIAKKLNTYLNNCEICKRRNVTTALKLPMKTIPTAYPMSELSMDIMGPIHLTGSKGQKYVLNVIDNGSRYIFPTALKTQQHEEVIDILTNEIFLKYGFPNVIRSDNATNFKSNTLVTYLKNLNIKVENSTPYYSQSNSPCERSLRTIQTGINKLINTTGKEWYIYLPFIAYSYNTSYIESLGSTPLELMFFRKAPTCLDLFLKTYTPAIIDMDLTQYEIMEKAAVAREIAAESYSEYRTDKNKKMNYSKIKLYRPGQEIFLK